MSEEWLSPTILRCKSAIPEPLVCSFLGYFEKNNNRLWDDSMLISNDGLFADESPIVDHEHRKAKISNDTKSLIKLYQLIDSYVDECVEKYIDRYPYYGEILSKKGDYSSIRYDTGSFYREHVDIGNLDDDDETSDRKIAIYIYLNDNYEGGILKFPYQDVQFKAGIGDVIVFDCGALHPHESTEIESGFKIVITNWLS